MPADVAFLAIVRSGQFSFSFDHFGVQSDPATASEEAVQLVTHEQAEEHASCKPARINSQQQRESEQQGVQEKVLGVLAAFTLHLKSGSASGPHGSVGSAPSLSHVAPTAPSEEGSMQQVIEAWVQKDFWPQGGWTRHVGAVVGAVVAARRRR